MTATGRPDEAERTARAVKVRSAVHAGGLVGGVGLKPVDLPALQRILGGPDGRQRLLELVASRVRAELVTAGIVYGLQEEGIEAVANALVAQVESGSAAPIARRVAQGDPPEPARDGFIEYPLNHRGLPFAQLAGLPPKSRQKKHAVVHAHDTLAIEHPPSSAEDGTSVKGDRLPAPTAARERCVTEVAGPHTVVDGPRLLAACDGLCEEDVDGWLRVIPEIVLPRVDQTTGRIPEAGVSEANIAVVEAVTGGPGIATTESVFVGTRSSGGTVEGHAAIQARHLVVDGAALGDSEAEGARIEVDGWCVVRQVRNRAIDAAHILVAGDCDFARLDAGREIRVDGTLRGGAARCGTFLEIRGDLGTEAGGSNTLVVAPAAGGGSRRARRTSDLVSHHRAQATDLRKGLDDLERRAQKRAKVDAYWARLLDGERPEPHGPVQLRAQSQFAEFDAQRHALRRRIDANQRAVQKLGEREEEGAGEGDDEARQIRITVGGALHLDVTFEVCRAMTAADEPLAVSFTLEGQRLAGKSLADVRAYLLQQVAAYREQQSEYLEERRKALEELHKGQSTRPEALKMQDRTFALPISWEGDREGEDAFAATAEVSVRALQPDEALVRTCARLKAPARSATVAIGCQGARGTFGLTPNRDGPHRWQDDGEVRQALGQIAIRGATAIDVLEGTADIQGA